MTEPPALTFHDLEDQEDVVPIDEASKVKLPNGASTDSPKCLACAAPIRFDDDAMEAITFRRPIVPDGTMWARPMGAAIGRDQGMCENRQSVFSCPALVAASRTDGPGSTSRQRRDGACRCRQVIYAEGEIPMTNAPGELCVHPPEDGYYLAKVAG